MKAYGRILIVKIVAICWFRGVTFFKWIRCDLQDPFSILWLCEGANFKPTTIGWKFVIYGGLRFLFSFVDTLIAVVFITLSPFSSFCIVKFGERVRTETGERFISSKVPRTQLLSFFLQFTSSVFALFPLLPCLVNLRGSERNCFHACFALVMYRFCTYEYTALSRCTVYYRIFSFCKLFCRVAIIFLMLILYSLWRFNLRSKSINSLELTPSIMKVDCLYDMLLLYSILYIVAVRSIDGCPTDIRGRMGGRGGGGGATLNEAKKKGIIDNNTIHYLLCRVITQDCLTFIIYYDYTYCICIIIYNNVWNKI